MAYKFKLQSVLNYRQILEDQAQQQLSSSLQQRLELQQQMTRVAERLMQTDRELKLKQQKGMDIADLTLFEDQIQPLSAPVGSVAQTAAQAGKNHR